MKTNLLKLTLFAVLFSLSFTLAFALRQTRLSSASEPLLASRFAGFGDGIAPVADVSLFNSATAQVRPDLAPFCALPSHAVTLDVSRVQSYVLLFRQPHDKTTPFTQFLRPAFVPNCRFVRHHLVLVPAVRSLPGSIDIDYLPLQIGKQALMISETGGQPGTTVFTFPVPTASTPLDAAQARTKLTVLLSRYFLWSPKADDLEVMGQGANFECTPASASLPGTVFDTLNAEVTPNFVVIKMRNARLQDYKRGQAVESARNWFQFLEAYSQYDYHSTYRSTIEKEWQDCGGTGPGKIK